MSREATRWAEIEDGRVVNLVVADKKFAELMLESGRAFMPTRDDQFVDIGFAMVDGELVHPDRLLPLDEARAKCFGAIDCRTDDLFSQGFVFEGMVFSLTQEAQSRFLATLTRLTVLPYPLTFNTIDDTSSLTLNSPEEAFKFASSALDAVQKIMDSGTELKKAVREAKGTAEVFSVMDAR